VKDNAGAIVPGMYVAGWAKRGPTGVIGTNKKDAEETAALMLADVGKTPAPGGGADIADLLKQKGVSYVDWAEWKKIDAVEIERGKPNRPRSKLVNLAEMRTAIK
jgi:ferredoxin--NADP+ reductase